MDLFSVARNLIWTNKWFPLISAINNKKLLEIRTHMIIRLIWLCTLAAVGFHKGYPQVNWTMLVESLTLQNGQSGRGQMAFVHPGTFIEYGVYILLRWHLMWHRYKGTMIPQYMAMERSRWTKLINTLFNCSVSTSYTLPPMYTYWSWINVWFHYFPFLITSMPFVRS